MGNTRVSFKAENGTLVQTARTDFDPWGVVLKSSQANTFSNRFEYQGKEKDLTFGLNRISVGARSYNPTIGRIDNVDILASKFSSFSTNNYALNNPIRYIDPDGNAPLDIILLGANKSSVTVKTDLVDLKINAGGLGVDFGGNYTLSGNDVLQAAVDIGGVLDPTPTLDIIGASMSAKSGDYWGAGASLLGAAVPYAGDLAKAPKIAKGLGVISDAIQESKSLNYLRRSGVLQAWKQEKALIESGSEGTRNWTKAELRELKETGKVKGYEGHHINSVKSNPEMAGNPNNVEFVKRKGGEHLQKHSGNYRNPSSGDLINRN